MGEVPALGKGVRVIEYQATNGIEEARTDFTNHNEMPTEKGYSTRSNEKRVVAKQNEDLMPNYQTFE